MKAAFKTFLDTYKDSIKHAEEVTDFLQQSVDEACVE